MDVARWGLGVDYPIRVSSAGGRYEFKDDWQTPDTQVVIMDYPGRVSLMWESRSSNGRKIEGQDRGIIFYGENGSLDTGNDAYTVYDLDGKLIKEVKSASGDDSLQGRNTASPSVGMDNLHVMDFLDAIKTNRRPNCDVEQGYKSVMAMQLGNIAWRVGRSLEIDPPKWPYRKRQRSRKTLEPRLRERVGTEGLKDVICRLYEVPKPEPEMKPVLFILSFFIASGSLVAQAIPSNVYAWNQAPVVKYAGYEERTLLMGSTRDFSTFRVLGLTYLAKQPEAAPQQAAEETLVIVKEGELTLTIGGKTKTMGPGSVALIMPGDMHQLNNRSARPLTYYLMQYRARQQPKPTLNQLAGSSIWVDWNDVAYQPHQKGGIRRMFDRATVMANRFEMHVTTLKPWLVESSAPYPPGR